MRTFSLLLLLVLTACAGLRSHYDRPETPLPDAWQGQHQNASTPGERWWTMFGDPGLSALVDHALEVNADLTVAAYKISKAQLQAGLTATNLNPSVSVDGSSQAQRNLKNGHLSRSHEVSGSISYEVDLWGKLAAVRDQSQWEAVATEWDREAAALSIIGSVASAYWQIAYDNERIATARASIAAAEKTLALVQVRHAAGAVSGLDLVQARQDLAAQQATLPPLIDDREQARLTLSLLFDQTPQQRMPEAERLPDGPLPSVPAGIPADVLANRPDLQAAEARLRESLTAVDVAKLSFYPTFSLTGSLGSSSLKLAEVLQNPVGTLGAGLALPFVQWNTLDLELKVARVEYEQAVVAFRQDLFTALGEVEKALSGRTRYAAEGGYLEEALLLARESERLAEVRYRSGAISLQDLIATSQTRRLAEAELAANRLNRYKNLMALCQALGGGLPYIGTEE